jgi:hypothetical protein
MYAINGSNLSYMTPVGSYINTLSYPPLKKLKLDSGIKKYLNNLDENIKKLNLSNKKLENITDVTHLQCLIKLDISRTNIRSILYIPDTIEIFICRYNFLVECPKLNDSLKVLDLSHNLIDDMPEFTSNLEYVDVDNNSLKLFRNFNHGLQYLSAKNNNLIRLPLLPDTLKVLQVDNNNNLKIIPVLPDSLYICSMRYTSIFTEIVNIKHDVYEEETDRYNMEFIKKYSKIINGNIIKEKSFVRKYIRYICEKVIKAKFSPEELDIHIHNFVSDKNYKPETLEWFDEMIDSWNNGYEHIFNKSYNINYTLTNDQMYNDLINFYSNIPYSFFDDGFDNDYDDYDDYDDSDSDTESEYDKYYNYNDYYGTKDEDNNHNEYDDYDYDDYEYDYDFRSNFYNVS